MKNPCTVILLAGMLSFPLAVFAQVRGTASDPAPPSGCAACKHNAASAPIPGTHESIVTGSVENLVPIGVVTVLGCEKCAEETVNWALQQGSSPDDVNRVLRTVAAMQKLECFNQQFGPDVVARMDKALASATRALRQATDRAGK
jgi:hypothetical protein